MKVQRYSPHKGMGDGMIESKQGRFVLFEDYQTLKKELAAVEKYSFNRDVNCYCKASGPVCDLGPFDACEPIGNIETALSLLFKAYEVNFKLETQIRASGKEPENISLERYGPNKVDGVYTGRMARRGSGQWVSYYQAMQLAYRLKDRIFNLERYLKRLNELYNELPEPD